MAGLSISSAWNEGSQFGAREFRLLFPIAFLFIALPAIVINLVTPPSQSPEMYEFASTIERNGVGLFVLISLVVGLVQLVLNTFGSLAITFLALRPGTSVGESFGVAGRRLLPAVAALLLIGLGGALVMLPIWLMIGQGSVDPTPAQAGGMLLVLLVMLAAALALWAKLLPLTAVAAAEPIGPIGIIRRSWQLTNGHFWKLLGTLILIGILYLLVTVAIGAVFGLLVLGLVGNPLVSTTAAFVLNLVGGLLNSVAAVFILPFFARIYAQLSGRVSEVGEVFS